MSHSAPLMRFRRVVIGFHDGCGSSAGLDWVAQMAQLFQSELLGIFVEDRDLAEWSATRPLRQMTRMRLNAAPVNQDELLDQFAASASVARRRLARIAHRHGLTAHFLIERANPSKLGFEGSGPDDLITVVEPDDPMARLSYPFMDIVQSIARISAPVLYLPHGVRRRRGPVMAMAGEGDDEVKKIAADLARTLGEDLTLLTEASDVDREPARESLLVISRDVLKSLESFAFARLAAERMVPVLIAGPDGTSVT